MQDWLETPAGRCLLAWERARFDEAVVDLFGYHALQLGQPQLDTLQTNRMPHQWLVMPDVASSRLLLSRGDVLVCDFAALPFPQASLDLVVMPHTLEQHADPHATLREVDRVLVPEGRVVICGFNPTSLWAMRERRAQLFGSWGQPYLPPHQHQIGYWRLRDWLRLLSFEVESAQFGCYRPAVRTDAWLERFSWMDRLGARWWPIFGAAYFVVAVKRVRGMRLLEPGWRSQRARGAAVPARSTPVARSPASRQTPHSRLAPDADGTG